MECLCHVTYHSLLPFSGIGRRKQSKRHECCHKDKELTQQLWSMAKQTKLEKKNQQNCLLSIRSGQDENPTPLCTAGFSSSFLNMLPQMLPPAPTGMALAWSESGKVTTSYIYYRSHPCRPSLSKPHQKQSKYTGKEHHYAGKKISKLPKSKEVFSVCSVNVFPFIITNRKHSLEVNLQHI